MYLSQDRSGRVWRRGMMFRQLTVNANDRCRRRSRDAMELALPRPAGTGRQASTTWSSIQRGCARRPGSRRCQRRRRQEPGLPNHSQGNGVRHRRISLTVTDRGCSGRSQLTRLTFAGGWSGSPRFLPGGRGHLKSGARKMPQTPSTSIDPPDIWDYRNGNGRGRRGWGWLTL
jgi:hypothetical protein